MVVGGGSQGGREVTGAGEELRDQGGGRWLLFSLHAKHVLCSLPEVINFFWLSACPCTRVPDQSSKFEAAGGCMGRPFSLPTICVVVHVPVGGPVV